MICFLWQGTNAPGPDISRVKHGAAFKAKSRNPQGVGGFLPGLESQKVPLKAQFHLPS